LLHVRYQRIQAGQETRRAAQYNPRKVCPPAGHTVLRDQRAHAVPEEKYRRIREVSSDGAGQLPGIFDETVPGIGPGHAQFARPQGRLTMAPMIIGINHIATGVKKLGQSLVPLAMFRSAVGDLHSSLRHAAGRGPFTDKDLDLVLTGEGESRVRHISMSPLDIKVGPA
jgi:hypothetical protein